MLIGNCDAHGKNYSLLYDSPAPSLAPFYDLVCTAMYGELTTRLAMSIDGATMLEEVTIEAWQRLAKEVGFAPRFLELRMEPFRARVLEAASELAGRDEYADPAVATIAQGVRERAKRFRLPAVH